MNNSDLIIKMKMKAIKSSMKDKTIILLDKTGEYYDLFQKSGSNMIYIGKPTDKDC